MIPGAYFFMRNSAGEVFFCKAGKRIENGVAAGHEARCLNHAFDMIAPDDGKIFLPHTGERVQVDLIAGARHVPYAGRDPSAAISYYLKRLAVPSQGIGK